ncbi:VOC family protein [Actinoplanes sp. NPDC051513]|uniref:VOC family protein n=1 Tax=Actinoplanes sp. NPDC051513 TaxID=3363908 RepID=UPI0037957501
MPIPDNYRRITPCLVVRGADAALRFYADVFGGKERMRMAAPDGSVAHAEMEIGDSVLMVEDEDPGRGTTAPPADATDGASVFHYLYVEDVDAVVAEAGARGAIVKRAPQNQFYGDRDAFVIDPYGHGWVIGTHLEGTPA